MKKIHIISETIDKTGGMRKFLQNIIEINKRNNIQSTITTTNNNLDEEIKNFLAINEVNIIYARKRPAILKYPIFSLLFDFYIYKISQCDKSSLVIINSGSIRYLNGIFAFKMPILFFLHSIPGNYKFLGFPINFMPYLFASKNKLIITVSEYAKNITADRLLINHEFIKTIPNPTKPENRKHPQNKSKNNRINILTVGHASHHKNINVWLDVALNIIKTHNNVDFYWIGDGELLNKYCKHVNDLKQTNRIFLTGPINNVSEFYENSYLYFHPSLMETQGISIIEAMAHGLPCICSNVGGIPESVIDGKTGLLHDPNDVNNFTSSIKKLIDNPQLAHEMGKNGKLHCENKFNPTKYEKKIISLYGN